VPSFGLLGCDLVEDFNGSISPFLGLGGRKSQKVCCAACAIPRLLFPSQFRSLKMAKLTYGKLAIPLDNHENKGKVRHKILSQNVLRNYENST